MIISKITLRNWKNFQHCSVEISNRCFIVGANAAGKSNFLDVFRFLRDLAKQGGGLQMAVDARGGLKKIRSLSARAHSDVMIQVELRNNDASQPKWCYTIDLKNNGGGIAKQYASIIEEKVENLQTGDVILRRKDSDANEDSETLKYTYLEQATQNARFREIKDAFFTIEYLNVIPQLVRDANSFVMTAGKEDYYGRNFLQRMAMLNDKTRTSYLKRINAVMVKVVPQLTELSFANDRNGVPHLEARYKHWRAKGAMQNEMLFSDGTLRMIGFLFAMLDGMGIILLEEPEINLHSSVVAQMPEYIASIQRQKNRQVLITTHSFDILNNSGIRSTEVLFMQNGNEGTDIRNIKDMPEVKALLNAGFSVADALIKKCEPEGVDTIASTNKED